MKDNKSFYETGIYILFGMALSQISYGFMYNNPNSFATAAIVAAVDLTMIAFELAGRYKNLIK